MAAAKKPVTGPRRRRVGQSPDEDSEGRRPRSSGVVLVSPDGKEEVEIRLLGVRRAAPAWEDFFRKHRAAKGPLPGIDLWKARLYGSIQEWAQWGDVAAESIRPQVIVVEALLSLGQEMLDEMEADLERAMGVASDADNWQFFLTCLLSSSVQRAGGGIEVRPGFRAAKAKDSLGAWIWRTLVRPWLPAQRRRLDLPYRLEDSDVWAGALCWALASTGQADSMGDGLREEGRTRVFARVVARVAGGHLVTRREPPPWCAEQVAASRLRPDSPVRSDAGVKQVLHRAYVRLGGAVDDATGQEAVLVRLAVFLTAVWPFYWPAAIRRRPRGEKCRAFKVETNRLRRQLGLRGVPRRRTR